MEGVGPQVIAGLIVNLVTSAAQFVIGQRLGHVVDPTQDSDLDIEMRDVIRTLLAALRDTGHPQADVTRVARFLRTPDAQTLSRQIIVAQLTGESNRYDRQLRAQLTAQLSLCATVAEPVAHSISPVLFELLQKAGQGVIDNIQQRRRFESAYVRDESYPTLSWKSLLSHHLETIERTNHFYVGHSPAELGLIYEFEQVLRRQVHAAYGLITPPYARDRVQVPINDLYVLPGFRKLEEARNSNRVSNLESTESPVMGFDPVMQRIYRTVILGDPGAGKSTLLAKLAYDLSGQFEENLSHSIIRTPFVVILRDYQQHKGSHNLGMVDYIKTRANTKFHVSPPDGAIEYLMLSGRAIVLLDGLDELLQTDARQEVSEEVLALARRYPQTPIVVTSRRIGYEEARLAPTVFETFILSDFDQRAIEEYVHKWFALPGFRTVEEQQATPLQFLAESEQVHDLRANPLMLGLLCNIYQGENYIPRSRPEVYESCSSMLFEKWDRRRGIIVKVPYRAQLEPALKHLAFWIYSEGLAGGVQHHKLIERTKAYLLGRHYEDEDEAIAAAEELIDFCNGRAWVFTDVGTTRNGVPIYQFTHRTFLEYFAAGYLTRVNRTGKDLWTILSVHIRKGEWDVVAQIATQILDRQVEGATEEFLLELLKDLETIKQASLQFNLLSFAARCLEFVAPSANLTRTIVETSVEWCVASSAPSFIGGSRSWYEPGREVSELIRALMSVDPQRRSLVAKTFTQLCKNIAEGPEQKRSMAALYIALNAEELCRPPIAGSSYGRAEMASQVAHEFGSQMAEFCWRIAPENSGLALSLYRCGVASREDLESWLESEQRPSSS